MAERIKRQSKEPKDPFRREEISSVYRPLIIDILYQTNPDFKAALDDVLSKNIPLEYRELKRTPQALRKEFTDIAIHNEDLRYTVASALADGRPVNGDTAAIRAEIAQFMTIAPKDGQQLDSSTQAAVDALNVALEPERRMHIIQRLTRDRTGRETKKILVTGGIMLAAAGAAGGFNLAGAEGLFPVDTATGAALSVAGSADDVGGTVMVAITKRGGESGVKKVLQDIAIPFVIVGGAVAVDFLILSAAFAAATGLGAILLASGLYWLTATAGSMAAEGMDIINNMRTIFKLDKKGQLPGKVQLPQELLEIRNSKKFQRRLRRANSQDITVDFVRSALERENRVRENPFIRWILRKDRSTLNVEAIMTAVQAQLPTEKEAGNDLLRESILRENFGTVIDRARHETISNPYRSWLAGGLGTSLVFALGAGVLGLLPGRGILTGFLATLGKGASFVHGAVEAIIGPIENAIAYAGSFADSFFYDFGRKLRLKRQLKSVKRHGLHKVTA